MIRRASAGLVRDARGAVAVEFALFAPLLLALFIVGYALSDIIACNRKVATTARSVADLASRFSSVTDADVTTILAASAQVLSPYRSSNALVRVSEIKVLTSTSAQIIWSRAQGGSALLAGTTVTLPNGMAATGSYLILGEVSYSYTPLLAYGMSRAMTLNDQSVMSPRLSDQVPLS
ncbi:MAG: pilus assembly protein [Novosphingobium sp.]